MSEALFLIAGLTIGYFNRDVLDKLRTLQYKLKPTVTIEKPDEPKSTIVEALTPEQQARKDMEERVKRLNGQP